MSSGPRPKASAPVLLDLPGSCPPAWVDEWVGVADLSAVKSERVSFEARTGAKFSRFSMGIEGVEKMDTPTLQESITEAYRMVFEHLAAHRSHLLRTWAAIPRIHAGHGDLDRYMVFNAGRFAAYSAWLGGSEGFSRSVTTASAVGSSEPTLQIHGLASREAGVPTDNPRQVPAYRYSRSFGPLPPCFARATLLPSSPAERAVLLVGGTASIVGEESRHVGDLSRQIDETFRNLGAVIASACAGAVAGSQDGPREPRGLASYREIRLYHREMTARDEIIGRALEAFSGASRVEVRQAELCRPELLVEIEGVAELPRGPESTRWP